MEKEKKEKNVFQGIINPEEITKAMLNAKKRMIENLPDMIFAQLQDQVELAAHQATSEACSEFIKKELLPELKEYLAQNKLEILAGVMAGFEGFGKSLAEKIDSHFKEKIEKLSDYDVRSIIKAVAGGF